MKFLVAFAALIAFAAAASVGGGADADATVVRSELDNTGVEGFKYAYETSNGISHESEGHIINAGSENEAVAVSGNFKYTGADGTVYSVKYVADENGYQPEVSH